MSDLRDRLEELADQVPPPSGARREAEIRRAIEGGLAAPAPAPRVVWRWVLAGGSLAAAAAIALLLLWPRRGGERALVVEHGAIAAPQPGQLVEVPAGAPAVLRTPDASEVEATPATRFVRVDRAATHWRLESGALRANVTKRKKGETFEIATAEATVTVVGTRFVVRRDVVGGIATTHVRVEEGIVLVTPAGGEAVTLHAGDQWPAVRTAAATETATATAAATATATATATKRPAPAFDATAIRQIIRAGKVVDARRLIDDGRKATSSARGLAELGILAAEADLAERKTRSAITRYLDVVRDYPATPQAEQALFAAAQLAATQPDAGYKPAALLRDYLDTYPRGVFADDARRLLEQ